MKKIFPPFRIFDWVLVAGIVLCLPLVWSYMQNHFFHLHDFTHVARLAEFERGLLDGQLPIRWSQNLGYGYGMPQFSFYGPLFYMEALLFRIFGISFVWSVKLTVILQVIVSFVALYKMGVLLWNRWAGLVAGIAGIYAPYRLVDMYVRGAFAELSGMTCFVLTLWAIVLWAKRPKWSQVVFVAICGSGILISHTLMAIITLPFILIWLAYWIVNEHVLTTAWKQLLVMGFLAAGLSAWFAIPALFEKGLTQADQLTTGFSNYNYHFLYIRQFWNSAWGYGGSVWGIDDNVSFELGKVQIVLVIGLFLLMGSKLLRKQKAPSVIWLLGGMVGLSLFLSILKSKPVWDLLPFMMYLQFPWRFLSVTVVLLGLLAGSIIYFLPKQLRGIFAFVVIIPLIASQLSHAKPETFLSNDDALYYSDRIRIQTIMSDIIPDFLPKKAQLKALQSPVSTSNRYQLPSSAQYSVEIDRSNEFLIWIQNHDTFTFTAHIFDFPGWTIYYDGKVIPHQTQTQGLIEATIPAGVNDHFISGRFEETPLRIVADCMTSISIFVAGMLGFMKKKEHTHAAGR